MHEKDSKPTTVVEQALSLLSSHASAPAHGEREAAPPVPAVAPQEGDSQQNLSAAAGEVPEE